MKKMFNNENENWMNKFFKKDKKISINKIYKTRIPKKHLRFKKSYLTELIPSDRILGKINLNRSTYE